MADVPQAEAEKILVCVSPSPFSAGLLHSAKKMADSIHAPWFAVYVEEPKALILPEAERNRIVEHLRLAEQLGAETVTLRGRNVAEEVVNFARQRKITRIIIGKPKPSGWKDMFSRSPVDRILRTSGDIEVQVISGEPVEEKRASYPDRAVGIRWPDYGTGILYLVLATILCFLMLPYFDLSNLIMVYLLEVLITAIDCGRGPAVVNSALSVLAFDFCFVPPRYSFTVDDLQYVVTFVVMFVVALAISHLAAMTRRQADLARSQEQQANAMHGLSRQLASSRGTDKILQIAVQYISEIFDCRAVVLLPEGKNKLAAAAGDVSSVFEKDMVREINLAQSAFQSGRMTGWGIEPQSTHEILYVPLSAAHSTLGVLAFKSKDPARSLPAEQLHLLESLVKQVALSLEVEYLISSRACAGSLATS
jgi:two-component system sensor histidine kinase KdpD